MVDIMSRVEAMRKLRDECIIAEQACADNADVATRLRRDRLLQQLTALTLGSQSTSVSV